MRFIRKAKMNKEKEAANNELTINDHGHDDIIIAFERIPTHPHILQIPKKLKQNMIMTAKTLIKM